MSGGGGEMQNPGGSSPDSGTSDVQSVEQRSDAGVGGEVYHEKDLPAAPAPGEEVQDEPVLAQNNATTQEKLDGIAAQTRVDLGDESNERYEEVLRQRLHDSEIQQTDEEISDLARRSSGAGGA